MNMLYLMLLLSPDNPAVVEESCEYAEINTVSYGDRYLVQIIFWEKGKSLYEDDDGVRRYYDDMVVKGFKVVATERGEHNKKIKFLPYRAGKNWHCSWEHADGKIYRIKFKRLVLTKTDYDVEVWHSEHRLHRDFRSGFLGRKY